MQIKERESGAVVFEDDSATMRETVEAAFRAKAPLCNVNLRDLDARGLFVPFGYNLEGAGLAYADLRGSNLRGVRLRDADLHGSRLDGASLRDVDLERADLHLATLQRTDLTGACLSETNCRRAVFDFSNLFGASFASADLRTASFYLAYLEDARFTAAKLNWQSHDLLGELLFRAAGDDVERLKCASFVRCVRDHCWDELLELNDPYAEWALEVLAGWTCDGDGSPALLAQYRRPKVDAAP